MYDLADFIKENKGSCILFVLIAVICISGIWFLLQQNGNEPESKPKPVYSDSNESMERFEKRLNDAEQRIERLQERVANAEKTVTGITETIGNSRTNADAIANGLTAAEARFDSIIQRQGSITNRITDIETEYRKRTEDP